MTFRAHLLGTNTASSSTLADYVGEWLAMDGTVPIDVVLTNIDQSCPLAISSLRDAECNSGAVEASQPPVQSGVPLIIVIGVSVGVGVLLVVLLAVTITVVVLVVSARHRRLLTVMEAKSQR